jgi:hypothetical protein
VVSLKTMEKRPPSARGTGVSSAMVWYPGTAITPTLLAARVPLRGRFAVQPV